MLSLRKLLLDRLYASADGSHTCKECTQYFGPKSDSAAWKKHFALKHPADLALMLRELKNEPAGAAAASSSAAAAMDIDDSSSVASRARPASASVASSAASSNAPPAKKTKRVPEHAQPTVATLFAATGQKAAFAALASAFTHSSIGLAAVETEEFRRFLRLAGFNGLLPTRASLKASVLTQSAELRDRVSAKLAGRVVSIAADGWTNVRQEKVTNIVTVVEGKAFYWCSIVNKADRNTAEWQAERILVALRSLINEHGARVVAYVVDNEAVNRATFELMKKELRFLVHVPCAAHTLQLIVRSCLKHASFSDTVAQLSDLIRFFDAKENRLALLRQFEAQRVPPLAVLKPNDTRWSSTLVAAERILRIQKQVQPCYDSDSLSSLDHTFFPSLSALCVFLKPFQVATDVIQSDVATLYTVYEQFIMLQQHVREKAPWAEREIKKRWDKQINVAVACAILSFTAPPAALNVQAAQNFIKTFGSDYLHFYQPADEHRTKRELKDLLTLQLAEFNGRSGAFASLDEEKQSMERAGGGYNSRRVWLLHGETALGKVALALLSIAASEAAVERTFSAQAAVHSKKRNRMHGAMVEAEMFLKFNARPVLSGPPPVVFGSCREITDESEDLFADEEEEEAEEEEEQQQEEEAEAEEEEQAAAATDEEEEKEAVAASSAASRRAARRASSITFVDADRFISWFIAEHNITAASTWNSDTRNNLQHASSKLHDAPSSVELESRIKAAVAERR